MWKIGTIPTEIIDNSFKTLNYLNEPFNDPDTLDEWKSVYGDIFNTGEMADYRQSQPNWTKDIIDFLNLKLAGSSYYRMKPGKILPYHVDTYKRYIEHFDIINTSVIHRAIVFLEDWKPGHVFEIDGYPIVNYRAGTFVMWQYDTPHLAANIGPHDRYTLQITGIL
jgi:hypothetical protein